MREPTSAAEQHDATDRAFISFRIGPTQWLSERRFAKVLDLFDENRGVTDEISLFTSETHPPLPLEIVRERAEILGQRMPAARSRGYRAGINVLATIGHHEENLANSLQGDYPRMTDLEGRVCNGSLCPNSPNTKAYVAELYGILARAEPDFFWIDDDVRLMGHAPIRAGCFCDTCLSIFAGAQGRQFSREALKEAFDKGSAEARLQIRMAWLDHNRKTIRGLFELIESTVHTVKPGLPLGFMTGDRFFEGYDFDTWAAVLSGPGKAPVRWRPGGGFYDDHELLELIGKSHDCGRQVSLVPSSIEVIQSEIENFPYQRLKKAARTTALEAGSHIAAGCTGAAFNVLSMADEPLDEYEPLVAELRKWRPFYDLCARSFRRDPPTGIWSGWGKDVFAAHNFSAGAWLQEGGTSISIAHADEILQIGCPPAYSQDFAAVTALSADNAIALGRPAVERILSTGVYLDAAALQRLNAMGYGKLTGFAVEDFKAADCIEELTDDTMNAGFSGRRRDCRQSFWKNPAAVLRPLDPGARVLSRTVDYAGREVASCCLGLFENSSGGRVCVAGYYPWTFLQSLSKSTQIKSIMRWLSRDTLPAYIGTFHRVSIWARTREEGIAVGLINTTLDLTHALVVMIKTTGRTLRLFDENAKEIRIKESGTDGPYRRFELPPIGAWEMRLGIV